MKAIHQARRYICDLRTHRPAEKSHDVVNFVAGYTYKNGAPVVVKIGKDSFSRLFTDGDKAWAIDDKADKELVAGNEARAADDCRRYFFQRTKTKDTYSLKGFTRGIQSHQLQV